MVGYLVISVAIFLMLRTALEHISFQDNIGFLQLKQDYLDNETWRVAFYTHVFTSAFCLLAGLTQFSSQFLVSFPKVHRFVGWCYVFNILVINFPAALIMAYHANGLLPSKIAFIILDTLWFWYTLKAVLEARKGNYWTHKEFMVRSFALTFSAITLRSWKIVLMNLTDLDSFSIYMITAWLGFVPNLVIAELLIWRGRKLPRKL